MRRAARLARKGIGTTSPNPRVGAVVVRGGRIVGEGHHQKAGGPHAEIIALRKAGPAARGATLYVTLEPCAHFGRTPPCVDAILRSGVKRVVIGEPDPNPITARRGIRALEGKGLEVRTGILAEEARELNLPFRKWVRTGFPYVTLKVAQSLDGRIATRTGRSSWISSVASRRFAHGLRRRSDAVLVGVETVLRDDPRLTARYGPPKSLVKVVLDSHLRVRPDARIFKSGRVLLATTPRSDAAKRRRLAKKAEIVMTPLRDGRVDLRFLLRELGRRGVLEVLVEGGGEVHASFVQEKLADELYFFVAPILIGGKNAPSSVMGLGVSTLKDVWNVKRMEFRRVGRDFLIHGYLG